MIRSLGLAAAAIAASSLASPANAQRVERIYVCAVLYQYDGYPSRLYVSEVYRGWQGLVKETTDAENRTASLEHDNGNDDPEHVWSNCWAGRYPAPVRKMRSELIDEGHRKNHEVREYTIY